MHLFLSFLSPLQKQWTSWRRWKRRAWCWMTPTSTPSFTCLKQYRSRAIFPPSAGYWTPSSLLVWQCPLPIYAHLWLRLTWPGKTKTVIVTRLTNSNLSYSDLMFKHVFLLWYALALWLQCSIKQPTSSLLFSKFVSWSAKSVLPGVCMYVFLSESLIPPYDHSWGYRLGQRFRKGEDVEIAHLC